jgi:hypothetical protein
LNNNRGNNNRRRGRGNNNRVPGNGGGGGGGGGQQVNRIDSRARGNAPQLLEKYRKMAQDAHLNGDRVQAEYYLQFADHYFRVTADTRLRMEEQRLRQNGGQGYAPSYGNGGGNGNAGSVSGDHWQDQDIEDEALEFGMDANFAPPYERAPRREEQPRPEQSRQDQPRPDQSRQDQSRQDQRDNRDLRNPRQRDAEPVAQTPAAAPVPLEGLRADEGEPIAPVADNPFIRDARGPRGLRGRNDRRGGRRDDNDPPRNDAPRNDAPRAEPVRAETARPESARPETARPETDRSETGRTDTRRRTPVERAAQSPPLFDPSSLPPAIGARADAVTEAPVRTRAPRQARTAATETPAAAPSVELAPVAPAATEAGAPKKRGRPRKNPLPDANVGIEG